MGLLDRHKRKPAPGEQPAPAAEPVAAAPIPTAQGNPLSSAEPDSLRDMLIAAISARDQKLFARLINSNRQTIADNFPNWQKVPEAIRENGAVMQRYANTLIALGEFFRDQFGDMTLIKFLTAPQGTPGDMQQQWQEALGQTEAMVKELRYDDAKALLEQVLTALATVPKDTPVPFHAITNGRMAHILFATGDCDNAANHMWEALQLSQQRGEHAGAAAALRGLYEIHRYMGKLPEAAGFGDRLSAKLATMGKKPEADFWTRQSAIVRAGEPLCRVVFYVNDQQLEVDDVPPLTDPRLALSFMRNRPPLELCAGLVDRGMQVGSEAKFDEAMALFQQAAVVDPYDPVPHMQMAMTLMHLERAADAVTAYDAVERLAPGWQNSRADRWVAAEIAAGRLEPAIFFILRTEEMPENAASWEQKLSLADQAISRAGEIAPLLLYRARCLMRLGRVGEAEPVLRAGLEKAQEPDLRTRMLVDLQMISADRDEGRKLLSEAVALNGNLAAAGVARIKLRQMGG
ncbi:MAG TPA: hypothetical protein VFE47_01420 [Tepidisphaeraceae bacterium]|jgi:tetratricopeptide (TPR) repeat protein|nr:hypothetical protein [Tepidisphaeraceae bacterium]